MAEALGQGRCLATAKDSDSMGLGNAARIMPREDAIDPDLPIIDPHHHLWQDHPESHYAAKAVHPFNDIFAQDPVYLRDEFLADLRTGHNIIATVYVECGAFYHEYGSENDRALGEIERVVEIAQACAGDPSGGQPCAAIVGYVDLTSDDAAAALAPANNFLIDLFISQSPRSGRKNTERRRNGNPGRSSVVQTILSFPPQGRSGGNHAAFLRALKVETPQSC